MDQPPEWSPPSGPSSPPPPGAFALGGSDFGERPPWYRRVSPIVWIAVALLVIAGVVIAVVVVAGGDDETATPGVPTSAGDADLDTTAGSDTAATTAATEATTAPTDPSTSSPTGSTTSAATSTTELATTTAPTTAAPTTAAPTTAAPATTVPATSAPATNPPTEPDTTEPDTSDDGSATVTDDAGRSLTIFPSVDRCGGRDCLVAGFEIDGFPPTSGLREFVCEFSSGARYVFRFDTDRVEDACYTPDRPDTITIEVDGLRSETVEW